MILSTLICFLGLMLVVIIPVAFLAGRFREMSPVSLALGVGGMDCLLLYLKPAALSPLWIIPTVLLLAAAVAGGRWRLGWLWPNTPTLLLALYVFLIFFFRWEPPGGDPVKWGALARLIDFHGTVPGDTRPLTPVTDLHGASSGVPLWIVLFRLGLAAWERAILFVSCVSVFLFCLAWRRALDIFLDKKSAEWAVLISLALFTNPQSYFVWGGTPTLLGMTFGLTLIEIARRTHETQLGWGDLIFYSSALAFAGYAHPIGVAVSTLVLFPVLVLLVRPRLIKTILVCGAISALVLAPFLLDLRSQVSGVELDAVWKWQKEMAPYLFREEKFFLYNLYTQVSAYLWNTAFLLAVLGCALWSFRGARSRGQVFALWAMLGAVLVGVGNARGWWLPLSFLFYPERVGTLAVVPLSVGLGFIAVHVRRDGKKGLSRSVGLLVLVLIVAQFPKRLWPALSSPGLTEKDRALLREIPKEVPPEECVGVTLEGTGAWIAVSSFRCTQPFHGLSMSTLEEERKDRPPPRWHFYSEAERGTAVEPSWVLVRENGARLYRAP